MSTIDPRRYAWRRLAVVVAALAGVSGVGCTSATQNVRAYRAYAHEDASLKVSIDRVEDIARVLELVDRIVSGTSYTPGDQWPRRLALSDADARMTKDALKEKYPYNQGDFEVPIVKVYRDWIETELREYGPPPEKAMYPSILDAVAGLMPRGASLKDHYSAYRQATADLGEAAEDESRLKDEIAAVKSEGERKSRDPEFNAARSKLAQARTQVESQKLQIQRDAENLAADAKLDTPQKQQIARDAFTVLSVVLRVEMEALALLPVVAIQTIRSLPTAPRDLTFKPHLKIIKQVWSLPVYIVGLEEHIARHMAAIEVMTGVLGKSLGSSISESPGFQMRESVVDQIVGVTLDSFRLDVRAGGDSYIYSSIGTGDRSSSKDGKSTYDYRGRQYKLDYRIEPIVLASGRLDLTLDWIRMPGVARLGFGYSTDRVFRSGGSIENTSLVKQLGIEGPASDIIDAAIDLLGVRSSVRVAKWTAGSLHQVNATDVTREVASAPLQLQQTQLDLGYDILWALNDAKLKSFTEEIVVGGRYLNYTLPRVVYELRDVSTKAGETHFAFVDPATGATVGRESPAQPVTSQFYMLGATARFGQGEAPRWSPFLDLGIYGGAGPTAFYFLKDTAQPDTVANRDAVSDVAFVGMGHTGIGLRWRLFPRAWRVRLDLRALYQADFLYSTIHRSASPDGRARTTDFGSFDVFHGPSLAIRGSL